MPPAPHNRKEAFSRVLIDNQLRDAGWRLDDGVSVRYEYHLPDGTFADYVLCDRNGRSLAVVEAKRTSRRPRDGERQARAYAEQLTDVPFVFLANGEEVLFWDYRAEAHPRPVAGFFSQGDLERRLAGRQLRVDPLSKPVDLRIVERDYQKECIDTLCGEINAGRRKLLVEMATGTGKTRTAAALIKRLFDASAVTRVLFLVDRITLAKQTEDAFTEHLRDLPCYVLRAGRRFQDEKRITITTLQSMINVYRDYSPGYFDLIVTDECHRSIYGQWSGILKYFDGVQIGLTATPCTAAIEATGDEEDKLFVRDTLRFFEVERPNYRYTLKEAVNDGHLVPYQIYKAKTVKTAAEGGFPVKRSELDWSALSVAERAEFEKLFQISDPIMVDPNALERRFTIPERNRAIVREYQEVLANGYIDKKGVQRKPLIGKTIVFAVTKRHAETLAQMFDDAFAHEKSSPEVRYADFVVSGCGPDDTVDAATKIKRFKKEKFPQILVSVNMLDTGFDAPEVVNLILARFTKSVVLYRQMRGRGTRKAPGKPLFTMFDFVGVTDFHADDETLPEAGIIREGGSKPGQPRTLLTLDVNDRIDPTTREWITIDENGNLTFLDTDARQQGLVAARFEAWLAGRNELHGEERRLLLSVGAYLKANADRGESFTLDHFRVPPFVNSGGIPRAIQNFGSEERLRVVLESLNRAVFEERDSEDAGTDHKFL